eukprot:436164_1
MSRHETQSISSETKLTNYVKQLENGIDLLNNISKENENEINYLRKEITNHLNQRFDELIHMSNFKINQQKQTLFTQLNDIQMNKPQINTNHDNIHNKPIVTSTVNIDYNKQQMLDWIKNFGNVNESKIKYKIIPNGNGLSLQQMR